MNPWEAILESPHRWIILAGISSILAVLGTIMMLTYGWSHTLARVWFYVWAIAAVSFAILAFLDWKRDVEAGWDENAERSASHGDAAANGTASDDEPASAEATR